MSISDLEYEGVPESPESLACALTQCPRLATVCVELPPTVSSTGVLYVTVGDCSYSFMYYIERYCVFSALV